MNEELKIVINAEVDKLNKACKKAQDDIKGIDKEANKSGGNFRKAMEKMSSAARAAGDKINKAFKTVGKVVASAVGAAGVAIGANIKKTAEYGDYVDKMSQKMGFSAKAFQEWDFILQHNGTSMETLKASMKTLTTAAVNNSDAFAQLGISMDDLNNMSPEELFEATITALQGVEDETQRTALAGQLLGRGATELGPLLNSSAEDIAGMKQEVHDLGGVMGDDAVKDAAAFQDSLQNLKEAFGGITHKVGEAFIPILTEAMEDLTPKFTDFAENTLPKIEDAFSKLWEKAQPVLDDIKNLAADAFDDLLDALDFVSEHATAFEILGGTVLGFAGAIKIMNGALTIYNTILGIKNGLETIREGLMWRVFASEVAAGIPLWAIIAIAAAVVLAITGIILVIKDLIGHWDEVKESSKKSWQSMKDACHEAVEKIKEKFQNLKEGINEKVTAIKEGAIEKWNSLKEGMHNIVEKIKENTISKFGNLKDSIKEKVENAKTAVHEKFEAIKTGISEKVEAARTKVKETFDKVKDAITKPVETAKTKVKELIDKIKGFFKFKWKLPELKMPHVQITGKFNLLPPSVPHFSLSWHKLGGVFDAPTLFGFNGGLHGLGEDGAEAIVPLEKNTKWLDRMATMLAEKQGGGRPIYLQVDGKTFAQISVDSINELTKQTGNLPLVLA